MILYIYRYTVHSVIYEHEPDPNSYFTYTASARFYFIKIDTILILTRVGTYHICSRNFHINENRIIDSLILYTYIKFIKGNHENERNKQFLRMYNIDSKVSVNIFQTLFSIIVIFATQ